MGSPSSKHPNLSMGVEKFIYKLESLNSVPLYELSAKDARNFLEELQERTTIETKCDIIDKDINTEYGLINVRTVRPCGCKEKLPAILYFHGGGWILGSKSTHSTLINLLSEYSRSAVIFPEYSLSPESSYPVAIDQGYSILKYIYANADEFNIDRQRIAVAGDSAGGNMATVIAMMIKNSKENNIELKYQALFYPVTSSEMKTGSYNDFKNGPWLSKKAMEWFWNAYAPDKQMRSSVYISPLNASEEELCEMPPALIITAENDVLRDEGEEYARKLNNAGVEVTNMRINGTIHDFLMLNALYDTSISRDTLYAAGKIIQKALNS